MRPVYAWIVMYCLIYVAGMSAVAVAVTALLDNIVDRMICTFIGAAFISWYTYPIIRHIMEET